MSRLWLDLSRDAPSECGPGKIGLTSMAFSLNGPQGDGLELGTRRFLHPGPLLWLRATGWAVALFMIFMLIDAAAVVGSDEIVKHFGESAGVAYVVAICPAALALYAGLTRLAEGRWPQELDLKRVAPDLLIGLAIGAAMLSAVVILLVVLGQYGVSGPFWGSPLGMIRVGISSGVLEELIMRAILLRLLMRAFGAWPALLIQAALFGAMHLANPNASPMAAVAIAMEAGLMLAAFYMLTGRLWMSIGVHAAWNFTQGWVWGAAVSGIAVKDSLFVSTPKPGAPALLSGGAFGPEASLPAMVIGTGVAMVVLHRAWKRGNFRGKAAPTDA